MAIAEDVVRESLKSVVDPELFVNIVDLGLIYEIKIDEQPEGKSNVTVEMTMTSPACPAGPQLLSQSQDGQTARRRGRGGREAGDGTAMDAGSDDGRRAG